MPSTLHRSLLCAITALALGCSESATEGDGGLGQLGSDLKGAGDKMAGDMKDAGAAMSKQLTDAGGSLDKLAADATAAMGMKGDDLAKMLKAKLPDLEKVMETVKTQLNAKGGSLKDMVAGLTSKHEGLTKALDALTKAGAGAGADVKKSALDAFASLSSDLKAAMAKLSG